MKRTLSNVLLFAAGVAVGSVATWRYFKTRYELVEETIDEEEIDDPIEESEDKSVNDRFSEDAEDIAKVKSKLNKKPPLKEYVEMVKQLSYSDAEMSDTEEGEDLYEPFIIRPEEYGELHAYDTLSLTYYADGVLTDDLDNRIEDVESLVPADFAEHFGEYEDDSVFVRNDNRECDYEILRDLRNFADAIGDDSYPPEDE